MQIKNKYIIVRWTQNGKLLDNGLIAERDALDKAPRVSTESTEPFLLLRKIFIAPVCKWTHMALM